MTSGTVSSASISAPVVLFVYRRTTFLPDIFDRIAAARPPRLYVFADAPREGSPDVADCEAVMETIQSLTCPCPVTISIASEKLGNSQRLCTGINAVFEVEDRAIFIEDDVVLSPSFLGFCDTLLERYRATPEVMMISGLNPLDKWHDVPEGSGYHFSTLGHAQAWATWRDAWTRYAGALERWRLPTAHDRLARFLGDDEIASARSQYYDAIARGTTAWDYQWALARQIDHGLCAVPSRNLAQHGGHGEEAANVSKRSLFYDLAGLHTLQLDTDNWPPMEPDRRFDRLVFELGNDRLSPESAILIASRLRSTGRKLLAAALLRHILRRSGPNERIESMLRDLLAR